MTRGYQMDTHSVICMHDFCTSNRDYLWLDLSLPVLNLSRRLGGKSINGFSVVKVPHVVLVQVS